ncbi:hypothetical protein O6H91_20G036200 [Diphasiastrum complanatum]|uniref:Uncharacterized protein n=1 Tax=Diphasiastrum complanatum TaxID=34168 RepID=A0ACC2APF6_DIPCM|nr:hypothetical protein O6H91_20G036200 [Diphasiastrum complanatum]
MCPLRVILIFLSASVAGYFAWKTLWSTDRDTSINTTEEAKDSKTSMSRQCCIYERVGTVGSKASAGFWMLVDMASGRYLWHAFMSQRTEQEGKSR